MATAKRKKKISEKPYWYKVVQSSKELKIIDADPDLHDETIEKLQALRETPAQPIPLLFGVPGFGDENDIGLAIFSICIKLNPEASFAEITARYAEVKKTGFLETALALKEFNKANNFMYYNDRHEPIIWLPRPGKASPP